MVPIVPDLYIWLIGRISGKAIWDLRTITHNHLGRSGKVWRNRLSPTRVRYRKNDRLLFLNMFKNSSRPKPVGPRSSWSSEGPLKVFLSRLPSGASVYPLELFLPSVAFVYSPQLSLLVILRNAPISPRIVFYQSARSGPECPRSIIFLIGPIVVLYRLQSRPF